MANLTIFSTSARKSFVSSNADGVISAVLPFVRFYDGLTVTPSMLQTNRATAATAVGGKITPHSFISGAAWYITAHSTGQVGDMADHLKKAKVPSSSTIAILSAIVDVKRGAGIDAKHLRSSLGKVWDALMALPSEKPTETESLIEKSIRGLEYAAPICNKAIATAHEQARACYTRMMANRQIKIENAAKALAKAEEDKARALEQESSPQRFTDLFAKVNNSNPAQAYDLLVQMARIAGYTIAPATSKAA